MNVSDIRTDLLDEQNALDEIMSSISAEQWAMATPSLRWTVADQIGHLAYFDETATVAITDPDRFGELVNELITVAGDGDEAIDALVLGRFRAMTPDELLEEWRRLRAELEAASASLGDETRIAWYGPSMSSKSFLTARLMEVWAHGQDIVDTVDARRPPTDRLRHIAQLGFITRGWSYANRGLVASEVPLRLDLTAPSGSSWLFGPADAEESVTGSAEDFALVVTQRRHLADTDLVINGDAAEEWLSIAQAFAGGATDGPSPRN
jgi:uncharacterized protein (TIGR03084 family)